MIRVNLIPPEYIERINRKAVIAKAALAAVLVVGVVTFATLWQITRQKTVAYTLDKRQQELAVLQKDVDQVKAIEARIAEVERYLNAIGSVNKGRLIYTNFMQDLTSDLPATIWFSNIVTTGGGTSLSVQLNLNSRSAYDFAYWISYLETSGLCSSVEVGPISITETEEGRTLTAPVTFKYTVK